MAMASIHCLCPNRARLDLISGWLPFSVVYEGDFNVSSAVYDFACNVAAGLFCLPRCRRVDSPAVNSSGDFFGDAFG
jgi:hypothetical protein